MKKTIMNFPEGQFLHGGDYNPEQWLDMPEILEKDIEMLLAADCNVVTLGVFSWSVLEPEEGHYNLEWLEEIINRLYENGIYTILATPSGARPRWLAQKYPEVLRVDGYRRRQLFGERHNHCYTSPVYREKVALINEKLASRFADNPAVILWHISNEFGGECHCPLCAGKFQNWLEKKYGTIEELNRSWYTTFWSHSYQNFQQVESPSPIGDNSLHSLNIDWRRFVTDQTVDFMQAEIRAIRDGGVRAPVTTNMMYYHDPLDYRKFAPELDIISWDNYPKWHSKMESITARDCGMYHDIMRSLKRQPFLVMENSPGVTNWQSVSKLKKPGMHHLSALHAVAHGADGVLYFQIRQSRGASEKFHGAVIDHYGGSDSRTYQEVVQVGKSLKNIQEICGATSPAQVAIIYEWDNIWAMEDAMGPRNCGLHYREAVQKSYNAFRKQGMNVDLIGTDDEFSDYAIVVAPMLYMMGEKPADQIRNYVEAGGTFIMTYWSGIVDENDLCYLGGRPHNLEDVFGIRSKEIDSLCDDEENRLIPTGKYVENFREQYTCKYLCDLVELKGADPIMLYGADFYAGEAACTRNQYGKGKAFYICADAEQRFYDDLYRKIVNQENITEKVSFHVGEDMEVNIRKKEEYYYIFVQNFGREHISLDFKIQDESLLYGRDARELAPYETVIIKTKELI